MLPPMTITFTDGTKVETKPKASDGIRFERAYNMPIIKAFGLGEVHMEHLWYMAYLSCDHGDTPFDEWMDTVDTVEFAGQDEAASDPLGSAPTP